VWGQWTAAWQFTTKTDSSVGTDEFALQPIHVYPNPVAGECYIVTSINGTALPFALTDLTGRVILQGQLTENSTVLHVNGLSAGTYVLHVGNYPSQKIQIGF
jgi:hypothetical protein